MHLPNGQCPYQYKGGPDQHKISSNFHFHGFGHFCAKVIFFTFSSFCLDVIFSTNSWPSRIATSRDLDFQFMLVELISKLQIQIMAAILWMLSLKMVVFVCLMVMTPILTEPQEVGRAPWSYRTAIKFWNLSESNQNQMEPSYMLGIVRFSNQDFNAWR